MLRLLCVGALLLPLAVHAQPVPQDSLKVIKSAPIVVTATRTPKHLEDVAVPTTVVGQEEMAVRGVLRLSDLLAELTGLALFNDHGTGVQVQGFDPDYTLLLIDGEPVIGRTAGTLDLSRISVVGLDRVEIVRGPSSSLYGSEALAGVINLVTRPPDEGWAASVGSRYGTHQTANLMATVEAANENAGIRAAFDRYSSGGYDLAPDVFGPTAPRFVDYTADVRLHVTPRAGTTLRLGGRLNDQQQTSGFALTDTGAEVPYDETGRQREWSLHPELRHRFSNRLRGTLSLYAARYQTESRSTRSDDGALYYADDFDQRYGKIEARLDALWNARHLTTFGSGALVEALHGDRYEEAPSAKSGFAFVQHEWLPSRQVEFNVSARFDAHEAYAARLSPKLSVLVRPLRHAPERLRLRASVGSGFKAPAFRQLYLSFNNTAAGYTVFGTTELAAGLARLQADGQIAQLLLDPATFASIRAESSVAYNVGVVAQPLTWLGVSLNGFYNNVSDLIETQPVAQKVNGSFVYGYFNLARIYTRGVEAEFTLTPHPALTMGVGYQFLQAHDRNVVDALEAGEVFGRTAAGRDYRLGLGDYGGLFGRSPHSGTLTGTWHDDARGLTLSVRGTWRSRYGYRDVDGNALPNRSDEFVPGYALWNATVTKHWALPGTIGQQLTLRAGVENAFDVTRPGRVPSMPGRQLYVGFGLDF